MSASSPRVTVVRGCCIALSIVCMLIAAAFSSGVFDGDSASSTPSRSLACTHDRIQAGVGSDGSLHVVDARTYEFTGSYSLIGVTLDAPDGGGYSVAGVSIVEEDGTQRDLPQVEFQTEWRRSGGPAQDAWAFDETYDSIYAFCASRDVTRTFVFDYTYTGAVNLYSDASELYWQFVPAGWDVDTQDVQACVTLPVPSGSSVRAGENVLAWGHGSLDGQVSFVEDGTVQYALPKVEAGTFAEMRIVYPASWSSGVTYASHQDSAGLSAIQQEESEWITQTRQEQLTAQFMLGIPLALSVIMIVCGLVFYWRHGREYRPQFQDEYWRDVPDPNLHPAVVSRLYHWNTQRDEDLGITLMHLGVQNAIKIRPAEGPSGEYVLESQLASSRTPLTAVDRNACSLVFTTIGKNRTAVTTGEIRAYGKKHASIVEQMKHWQGVVDNAVDAEALFEETGDEYRKSMRHVSIGIFSLFFFAGTFIENFVPLLGIFPGCAGLFFIAHFMTRRSPRSVEIEARCKGLKRWLEDFTKLDEALPTDALVWGELLVYASIFGVADEVVKQINQVMPDLWAREEFRDLSAWFCAAHAGPGFRNAAGDAFSSALSHTISTAELAIVASSFGAGSSGGGGGFSGGGGGGFGGGGGGFSR